MVDIKLMRVGSTEEGGFTGKNNREVDGKVLDALCPRGPAASRNGALCKSFQVLGVPLRRIAAEKLNAKERTGPSHLVLGAAPCAAQGHVHAVCSPKRGATMYSFGFVLLVGCSTELLR